MQSEAVAHPQIAARHILPIMEALKAALLTCLAAALLIGTDAAVDDWNFTLPQLPFETDALTPFLDKATVETHYNKFAAGYVKALNDNIQLKCPQLSNYTLNELLLGLRTEVTPAGTTYPDINSTCFSTVKLNAGALYNHLLFFFYTLAPTGQTFEKDASEALKAAVNETWPSATLAGSFRILQSRFNSAAASLLTPGWVWLCVNTEGGLNITTTTNEDNPLMPAVKKPCLPILGLDVWEHAYIQKYTNLKSNYTTNFWRNINWERVSELLDYQSMNNEPVDVYAGESSYPDYVVV